MERRLASGQDAEEEWESTSDNDPPSPNYFMSPSSSNQIITLLKTCKESHSIVKENYTLLFPVPSTLFSSTWFSFSADFLYLDFGTGPHTLSYDPRHFTSSIPDPWYMTGPKYSRYPRPKFNSELLKGVKNLAISMCSMTQLYANRIIDELAVLFTGVKVLILADQLFNTCHEYSEELVWLRGQLGDEINSIPQPNADKLWHESEIEEAYRHLLTKLPLWRAPVNYTILEDENVTHFLQKWRRLTTGEMPIVIRRSVVTTKTKDMLIDICGSEDNFQALAGLDFKYIQGEHTYSGSLDLYQQLSFLELMLARLSADFDTHCIQGCSIYECGDGVEEDMPFLLHRIDMLVLEIMQ